MKCFIYVARHRHLYTSTQAGVQDYLANRLHELSEEAVEQFLLQFVYLAVSRPGSALERTIVELCSKTFRVAIKVRTAGSARWLV